MPTSASTGQPWAVSHAPAVNVVATCTIGAPVDAYVRNVCTGFTAMLNGGTAAPAAAAVTLRLIDGPSGGTKYLWQAALSVPATAGAVGGVTRSGIYIIGSPGQPMTLEFSAAGGGNTFQSVAMEGTTL